jgi:hypothetical protein
MCAHLLLACASTKKSFRILRDVTFTKNYPDSSLAEKQIARYFFPLTRNLRNVCGSLIGDSLREKVSLRRIALD